MSSSFIVGIERLDCKLLEESFLARGDRTCLEEVLVLCGMMIVKFSSFDEGLGDRGPILLTLDACLVVVLTIGSVARGVLC